MAATAAQIARLRRMVAEPAADRYTDKDLAEYVEGYPLVDERGEEPYDWDVSTDPPTQDVNEVWIPTYDLAAAAAEVWDEKAAGLADQVDLVADGASFRLSQAHEHASARARYYRARRALRTVRQRPEPKGRASTWLGNGAERDE